MTATEVPAVELRISINETEPLIWRQLVLPQTATLADLHEVIQAAFGWKNAHLFDFHGKGKDGRKRAIGILADDSPEGAESATEVGVLELFDPTSPGMSPFEYVYDFGDHWTHEIEVVGVGELPETTIVCKSGGMRGPVEDSGGVGGYSNLVRVIGDTKHPEYQDAAGWLEWVTSEKAENFDPTAFDLNAVNADLDRLSRRIWAEAPSLEDMNASLRRYFGYSGKPIQMDWI
ncbi:plasmid pRiA4b ORF-3 family protein [Paenarthrobacter sp. NPDC090522]|uniref:plasmid pRiA4b ORF-3 family protein n=1 Tax=Paenarthrobacter sp. NPDC090522 TaxID=3364383 RepID=UPI00381EA7A0